jgi:hypothetical protein
MYFQTATKLDGLCEIELEGVKSSHYKHWNGDNPKFAANLRTWGEAGVVKLRNKFTKKIDDYGYICMFVGYPRSRRVHITRDITWLYKMYFSMVFLNNIDNNTLSIKVREGDNKLPEFDFFLTHLMKAIKNW